MGFSAAGPIPPRTPAGIARVYDNQELYRASDDIVAAQARQTALEQDHRNDAGTRPAQHARQCVHDDGRVGVSVEAFMLPNGFQHLTAELGLKSIPPTLEPFPGEPDLPFEVFRAEPRAGAEELGTKESQQLVLIEIQVLPELVIRLGGASSTS